MLFATCGGLKGSLSLMLLRVVIETPWSPPAGEESLAKQGLVIQAQIVIWATIMVVLTLVGAAETLLPPIQFHLH
jgi:hypothetical protein